MNLLCRLDHLAGQDILVNGKTYQIGENGLCTDIYPEDAAMLLDQRDTWVHVHEEDYKRVKEPNLAPDTDVSKGVAHLELPPGEELIVPPGDHPAEAPAPKKRGRPRKTPVPPTP